MHELIVPDEMNKADRLAILNGKTEISLMEAAGHAVARAALSLLRGQGPVLIVCGTGNNGGDGFVAARYLAEYGIKADIFIAGDEKKIEGAAALALAAANARRLHAFPDPENYALAIDALFGAGLDRDITGKTADLIEAIDRSGTPVLAVDLPSGIDGRTGKVRGVAMKATQTVTFFRYKPGHFLLPGRLYCGKRHLADIGIDTAVLAGISVEACLNAPALWREHYPIPSFASHKYTRGHTLVISGPATMTGAARLLATAALRTGSGLVTMASPAEALPVHAAHLTSVMLQKADTPQDVAAILADRRFTCTALGPGLPVGATTRAMVLAVLAENRACVLDAGALSSFETQPDALFKAIGSRTAPVILTPHEGEFTALFGEGGKDASKIERAKEAAKRSGATVILKGADSVAAATDGKASLADNAPPWLATAGSGDVLAGIAAGLLAQGMPAFEAASAAVWLHGDAAERLGPGLVSSDLDEGLRLAIRTLIRDFPPA